MAFNSNTTKTSNKNLFVGRLVSKATGKTVSWINLTEEFSRKVFGCELADVTAQQAEETLPQILENQYIAVEITDVTAGIVKVDVTAF